MGIGQISEIDEVQWRETVSDNLRLAKVGRFFRSGSSDEPTGPYFTISPQGFLVYEIFNVGRITSGGTLGEGATLDLLRGASAEAGQLTLLSGGSAGITIKDASWALGLPLVDVNEPSGSFSLGLSIRAPIPNNEDTEVVAFWDVVLAFD